MPHQVITTTVSSPTTVKEARKVPVINVKVQEDKIELPEASNDSVSKSLQQEKGVFIPRHVTRTQPDQKVYTSLGWIYFVCFLYEGQVT